MKVERMEEIDEGKISLLPNVQVVDSFTDLAAAKKAKFAFIPVRRP